MNSFQNRLKQILNERNIKQSELSNGTGIDKGAISSYLNGKYMPKQNNITLIANYLNISPDYLLGITDDKNDFDHKHTLNEIVYKQLQSLVDIDKYHKFDEKLFNFMEVVKNGSFPVMEGSIEAIANLFDTNTLYLLGESDNYWDSEDPMDDDFKNKIKTRTAELLKRPDKLVEEYNKRKHDEYQKTLVNRAYNTLADLGIEKLMDKDIKSIESDILTSYYDIIIKYIKDTTKMVDFDKLIKEKLNSSNNKTNNAVKYIHTYYFDFLSLKDASTIDKISTPKQFENYVAFILNKLNYKISVASRLNSNKTIFFPDFHVFKNDDEFYIECKFLNDSPKIHLNIENWALMFEKITIDKKAKKVLAINIPISHKDKLTYQNYFDEIWDYYYFNELEKQSNQNKDKDDKK